MARTPEAAVKDAIKSFLKQQPNCWFFLPVSNGMGQMGVPDFVGCFHGLMFAIEAKAPGKLAGTTPLQKMQLNRINQALGYACVADDVAIVEGMFLRMRAVLRLT